MMTIVAVPDPPEAVPTIRIVGARRDYHRARYNGSGYNRTRHHNRRGNDNWSGNDNFGYDVRGAVGHADGPDLHLDAHRCLGLARLGRSQRKAKSTKNKRRNKAIHDSLPKVKSAVPTS